MTVSATFCLQEIFFMNSKIKVIGIMKRSSAPKIHRTDCTKRGFP